MKGVSEYECVFGILSKICTVVRISDLIDILIVSVIVYYLINLIRETRAMQLVKGIIFLFMAFFLSQWLKLNALNYILGGAMQIGAFAVIVIFQPELRNLLERMGRFKVGRIIDFASDTTEDDLHRVIDSIAQAASKCRRQKRVLLL